MLFDRVFSVLVLAVLSPVLLVAGFLVRCTSRGPVLYRAERAGRDGRPFVMYKFRTMHVGSDQNGAITAAHDPRVFLVGRALRRMKIDELPQLANVVKGDMALVGPRPEDLNIVRHHYDDFMRESLLVRPGVTGPGSLHYFAEEEDLPGDPVEAQRVYLDSLLVKKIALDLVYVRNRSRRYKAELLLRTALGIVGAERIFARRAHHERELATQIQRERES
ncbi:sugar transferase [Flexivirga oryzae]|uniref:sugar transferase n=1 Tax=Flexivirga oryzae TaxID=1794944 RepID=UPI00161263AB